MRGGTVLGEKNPTSLPARPQDSESQAFGLQIDLTGGSPCSDRAGHLGVAPVYRNHLHLLHCCGECPSTPTPRGAACPLSGRDPERARSLPYLPFSRGRLCPHWAYFLIFIMKSDLKGLLLKAQGYRTAGSWGRRRALCVLSHLLRTSLALGFHPFGLHSSRK